MGYQVWNGKDNIYTPGGKMYTAEEWKEKYEWIKYPGAKMIITTPPINGGVALEFTAVVENYKRMGAPITDDMTDEEICDLINEWDVKDPDPFVSPEERIAAALEAQIVLSTSVDTMSLDNETESFEIKKDKNGHSPAFYRIKGIYTFGLWPKSIVELCVSNGQITREEADSIYMGV